MDDDRVTVAVTPREHEVIAQAIEALAENPAAPIYQRGGQLVHVIADDHGASQPKIIELPQAHLQTILSSTVRFVADKTRRVKDPKPTTDAKKPKKPGAGASPEAHATYAVELEAYERAKAEHESAVEAWRKAPAETFTETQDAHPPQWCVKGIAARGSWPAGIRPLDGFSEVPFFRPDGTIVQEAGYDRSTRTVLLPNARFLPVTPKPSKDEARNALSALLELFADFPFEGKEHRSTALAGILTPFARHAFRGPVPLFLFDANIRGAGKSMLTDTIAEIVLGRPMARTSQATHEEEERKRITSILLAAPALVLIDNVDRQLGSAPLDAVLTAEEWSDRILGKSDQTTILARPCWYATGNNVQIKADTARRCCHARLSSPEENPEGRTGFKFPDLIGHVRKNRAAYVRHALTVLRAWFVAGRPTAPLKSWGSYEAWSSIVRQAIVWLEEPDPGETRAALELYADTESNALADLLAGWEELCAAEHSASMTIGAALAILDEKKASFTRLRDALAELVPTKPGQLPSARSVGMKFHHLRERVQAVGGDSRQSRRLVQDGDTRGAARWAVVRSSDSSDSTPPPTAGLRDYGTTSVPREEFQKQNKNILSAAEGAIAAEPQTLPLVPQSRSLPPSPAPPPSLEDQARALADAHGDDFDAVLSFLAEAEAEAQKTGKGGAS